MKGKIYYQTWAFTGHEFITRHELILLNIIGNQILYEINFRTLEVDPKGSHEPNSQTDVQYDLKLNNPICIQLFVIT